MNLIIAQREKLPNISGYFANRYANIAAAGAITEQGGAFYDNDSTSNAGGTIQLATSTTHAFPRIGFDADKGDSNRGIYKNGAHVQPNTISCKTWLRNA